MNEQKTLDYARIAQAIGYIRENFKRQPGLDEIAGEVALSTAHFQRMFTEWAGISPKKFLQYTSIEYAKRILNETHASLFDAAQETGLSGTGRLYDLFVNIELSLDEYRTAYLQVPKITDRKPVFVSGEVRDRLDGIVRHLGGRGMSASGLIENLARLHLEAYREDIEQWRKL